jgi:hypothetical protein
MSIIARSFRIMFVALIAISLAGLTGCVVDRDRDHDHGHDHDLHDDHDYHGMSHLPADVVASIL